MTELEKRDWVLFYSAWSWLMGFHQGVTDTSDRPPHIATADEIIRAHMGKLLAVEED